MAGKTKVLAITSDHHVNSRLGLCPPEGAKLGDGEGSFHPSDAQVWLWDKWEHKFWPDVDYIVRHTKGELYALVNGDTQDGPGHHDNVQQIAGDEETQAFLATRVFGQIRQRKPKKIWMVLGTEAHTGPGGASDASLARWLGADRDPATDAWATYYLRFSLNGLKIDAFHHGSSGNLPWTRSASKMAAQAILEYAGTGEPHPDLVIASHKHVHSDSTTNVRGCRAIITAAWSFKTGFGNRVAPQSIADVGGHIVVVEPDGRYEVIDKLYLPEFSTRRAA